MKLFSGIGGTAPVQASGPVPPGLLEAFDAYETALLTNDVAALDALFAPGPHTVRGDGTHLLVGHDAIAGFRSGRTVIPTRRVTGVLVRPVGDDAALLMASTRAPAGGATGLQTQMWQRVEGVWKVGAAHVSLPARPAPAVDESIWRVVGTPMVDASGRGPLDGATVAVKDLFAVAGQKTGAGNPAWLAGQEPNVASAPAVGALLGAGAVITGIARTDEFAYSLAGQNAHYGTPPNPAVPQGISGGSTSGPASAVALRQVDIGLGTDTAGSIRVPASYQGLVGLRTTHGAVSAEGVLPLAPSFDTVGWLTRDAATALRVAEVLLPAATATSATRTLALPTVDALATPDVARALQTERERLVAEGLLPPLEQADLTTEVLEEWFTAFRTLQAHEAWAANGDWITAHPGTLGADVAARFTAASTITDDQAAEARAVVGLARTVLADLLEGAVLVLPSSAGGAPARDAGPDQVEAERAGTLRMTCLAGLAGAPALSLPRLRTADGRPAGLCLLGAPGSDRDLLQLAISGGLA
ncbi:amidase [Kineosporia succinea]|uniref:Asp-tRNA(Asn)/Glu-tRNA(Gln) amidotransferase A subunit family amidase n=1 Tax=Kineosporia succinea TaxID=84632 RepID=A0ABT9PAT7_9ACTN|nr:amidase [Kineosporia succinea]MDP9829807.1 Asp-tRNA(Asn)/Glu-tRNA(Gln) amidotransferase A subunit family amidase [Kineosporia succinea]